MHNYDVWCELYTCINNIYIYICRSGCLRGPTRWLSLFSHRFGCGEFKWVAVGVGVRVEMWKWEWECGSHHACQVIVKWHEGVSVDAWMHSFIYGNEPLLCTHACALFATLPYHVYIVCRTTISQHTTTTTSHHGWSQHGRLTTSAADRYSMIEYLHILRQ